jgi:hypothetical protein
VSITVLPKIAVGATQVIGAGVTPTTLVAVDSLRITWGRGSVLEQTTPATAAFTVRDTSPGATFARRTDLIGTEVVLGWEVTSPAASATSFRGRVTDVQVRPRPQGGFYVDLAASSLEVDLANYTVAEGTVWPAETIAARRTRIAGLLPAFSFTGGITLPLRAAIGGMPAGPELDTYTAAQVDVGGRDLLSLLRELFVSTSAQPVVYAPGINGFLAAPRRQYGVDASRGFVMSAMLTPSADRAGRYVAAGLTGLHLDGQKLAYAGNIEQAIDSRLTRIEVAYLDSSVTPAYDPRTVTFDTVDTPNEGSLGRRTLSVSSIHATSAGALTLATAYSILVHTESRAPRLGAVGFSTAREPFPDTAHAQALLGGYEQSSTLFLGRTWLTRLGQRPLVGILGSTITYADGEWTVDLTPSPVIINPASPSTWAPLPVNKLASSTAVHLADLDPSVTVGDLGFLDVGAGFTTSTATGYPGNPT